MDKLVEIYKTLADSHRLNILQMLSEQEMSVCEIMVHLKISQPAVSHHLKILKQANLIKSSKQGKLVFYNLSKCGLMEVKHLISTNIENLLLSSQGPNRPSALRENPNFCELLGLNRSICEDD